MIRAWLAISEDQGTALADAYLRKIKDVCALIATQPEMGVARKDVAKKVRALPVDRYIIYFRIEASEIQILRLWHTSQDPKNLQILS